MDLVHIKMLRTTEEGLKKTEELARMAMAGDQTAIRQLAARDGMAADILVVGEAVSTVTVFEELRIPGQPRVQDGRARAARSASTGSRTSRISTSRGRSPSCT